MMKITWFLALTMLFALMGSAVADVEVEDDEDIDTFMEDDEEVVEEPIEIEEDYEEEEWDGTLSANDNIETTVSFPDYPDKKLPVGKDITMLIGVTNNGNEVYNISVVGAYLHSPYDFDYYIQNFTFKQFQDVLPPTAQYTLEYKFQADAKLEALDYWFSTFIIINGTRRVYKQMPINGTVSLTSPGTSFLADVCQVISTLVVVGGVGFALFTIFTGGKYQKKSKTKFVAPTAPKDDDDDDSWDADVYTQAKTSKVAKKGAKVKKAKKAD